MRYVRSRILWGESDDFIAPIGEAIEYETAVFKISGGGTRQDPVTPYEGPPNLEKDIRWYELMNGKSPSHTTKT